MKFRRIIHYIVLCLAVWLPLDNALAATVVSGCPMMSHAFERGLAATEAHKKPAPCHHATGKKATVHIAVTDIPADCASGHCCSICLLFGATGLPSQGHQLASLPTADRIIPASLVTPAQGRITNPFRPPIV